MNKKLTVTLIALMMVFTACTPTAGEAGPAGEQGPAGAQGPQGASGGDALNFNAGSVSIDALYVGNGSTFSSAATDTVRCEGDVIAFYSSDRRLKHNIEKIPSALNKISKISGYTYDWNDEFMNEKGGEDDYFMRRRDIGVIAQEVEEVLPEVVATRKTGIKAVRYDKIVPLLIEAVKELSNKIKDQEEK